MHARNAVTTIDRALGRVAPRSLQEKLGAFAAAEPTNWTNVTSHGKSTTLGLWNRNRVMHYSVRQPKISREAHSQLENGMTLNISSQKPLGG
jgi:hypothetical protein